MNHTVVHRENVRLVVLLRADSSDCGGPGGAGAPHLEFPERREEREEQGPVDVRQQEEALGQMDSRR